MPVGFTPSKTPSVAGTIFTTSRIDGIKPKAMSESQINTVQDIFKAFQEKLVPHSEEGSEPQFDNITEMNFKSGMIIGSAGGKPRYVHVSVLTLALQKEYQMIQSQLQNTFNCKKETLKQELLTHPSSDALSKNTERTAPRGWMRPSLDLSTLGLNTWFSNKTDARFEYYSQQKDSKRAHLNRGSGDPVYIHNEALHFFKSENTRLQKEYQSVWWSAPNDSSIQTKIAEEARDRAAEFVVFLGGSNGDRLHLYYEATSLAALRNDLDDRLMKTPFEKAMERNEPAVIMTAPTPSMVHRIGAIAGTLVGGVRKLCEGRRVADPASGASSPEGRGSSSSREADEGIVGSFSDLPSYHGSRVSLDLERGSDAVLPIDEAFPASTQGATAAEEGDEVRVAQEEFLSDLTGRVARWQEQAQALLRNKQTDFKFREAVLTAFAKNPRHKAEIDRLFDLESETVRPKDGTPCILDEGQMAIIEALRNPIYEPVELEEAWKSDQDFMVKAIKIYPWIVNDAEGDFSFQEEFITKMPQSTNQHPAIRGHNQKIRSALAAAPGAVGIWHAAETQTPTQAPLKGTELWLSRLTMDQLQKHSRNFHKDHIVGKQGKEGALVLSELIKRVRNEGLDKVFKNNQGVLQELNSMVSKHNPQNTGWFMTRPSHPHVSYLLVEAEWNRQNPSWFSRYFGGN